MRYGGGATSQCVGEERDVPNSSASDRKVGHVPSGGHPRNMRQFVRYVCQTTAPDTKVSIPSTRRFFSPAAFSRYNESQRQKTRRLVLSPPSACGPPVLRLHEGVVTFGAGCDPDAFSGKIPRRGRRAAVYDDNVRHPGGSSSVVPKDNDINTGVSEP